jgi:hypothetical protein
LDRRVSGCVLVGLEALGSQAWADLRVALVVEHRERQTEVEVVVPGWSTSASLGSARCVSISRLGTSPPTMTTSSRYAPKVTATVRHADRTSWVSSLV